MDIARHVFDTYFSDVTNPMVRHHLDSYADLLNKKIPTFIQGLNPAILLPLGDDREIRVFIGGKRGTEIKYLPPADPFGNAILPHTCRLENKTYALTIKVAVDVEYTVDKEVITKKFEDVTLGVIPLMVKSSLCYLSNMTTDELYAAGECKFELGGYFIITGQEKVLLTQERLAENMFYASKRSAQTTKAEPKTFYEKEKAPGLKKVPSDEDHEYISAITSSSEDGTKGPSSHFLIIPAKNLKTNDPQLILKTQNYDVFSTNRLAVITLPQFVQPVPLFSIFYALGLTNDQDIYDTFLAGIPSNERNLYDEIFIELLLSHEKYLASELEKMDDKSEEPNMAILTKYVKTRTKAGVYTNLFNEMYPHCELREGESSASFYRRKAYLLGMQTRMAIDVALGIKAKTDREHYKFKRLSASGDLCFQEFRRVYKELARNMRTTLDSKIHYQQQTFEGRKLVDLVQYENINMFWYYLTVANSFEKAFKGKWGGADGVSQVLSRFSYIGTIAHLRRINVDMDKTTKIVEVRRIHGSGYGMMCPIDNPDGSNIGLIKSMTLLSRLTTASPSSEIVKRIEAFDSFIPLSSIHPSIWDPRWTKVFLNSDLVGVFDGSTETFHTTMLKARRAGQLDKFVSLGWNCLDNEYTIFTDAGRTCRPLYREGTRGDQVKKTKKWNDMTTSLLDYYDSQELDTVRVNMEPFYPTRPSEIHGSAIFSASGSVVPYSDHNAATRNTFICQQSKQACSWANTAFNKRFDTHAMWLNYANRALCQTWTMNHVLGKDGCMPYGETAIVAVATYLGYNQDDSLIVNHSAIKRGLLEITYYHGYAYSEESVVQGQRGADGSMSGMIKSEFANLATDSRFRETVERNPGYDYSLLGADGVIQKGVEINDKTVLVGRVVPKINEFGQVIGYSDSSLQPKRGQHGYVDDVYVYDTPEGLRSVKIRISENRIPQLGDKLGSRHGQKGTCGMVVPEEDMPYSASGLRPDLIITPHAIPSRMTIGQLVEGMISKAGVTLGTQMDATAFSTQKRVQESADLLMKVGFHPYGEEILYNGQTGEMLQTSIFIGPVYYLRLKQMVEDKINYRDTGPRKQLTHQPLEGRANDGGLKIGEMERDCLLSHGVAKFWNESMMERSDKTEMLFQEDLGKFDANPNFPYTRMDAPYATRLMLNEIESMHISAHLTSS
jgi:DNA-directed RNA polymerase II subunit RPB2